MSSESLFAISRVLEYQLYFSAFRQLDNATGQGCIILVTGGSL